MPMQEALHVYRRMHEKQDIRPRSWGAACFLRRQFFKNATPPGSENDELNG